MKVFFVTLLRLNCSCGRPHNFIHSLHFSKARVGFGKATKTAPFKRSGYRLSLVQVPQQQRFTMAVIQYESNWYYIINRLLKKPFLTWEWMGRGVCLSGIRNATPWLDRRSLGAGLTEGSIATWGVLHSFIDQLGGCRHIFGQIHFSARKKVVRG